MHLFFDVETTGLIDFKADLSAPHQPRITQIAACLVNGRREPVATLGAYIKPDGWTVPAFITEKFGVTTEMLQERGIPMQQALALFNAMKAQATHRVAYNLSFDKQMMKREELAYGMETGSDHLLSECAMELAKPICKMAPTDRMMASGIRGNKPPKLTEAFRLLFGYDFVNPHDAMADVRAAIEVYFAVKDAPEGLLAA